MDYAVRTGPLADLTADLRRFAADRAAHGKTERAQEAEAAATLLEQDAVAYFERVIYAVDDEGAADDYAVVAGSRADLERQLDEAGLGWVHQGETGLARQAARALAAVRGGAGVARVGHIVYEVRA
jgi:hypothetical protein